MLLAFGVQVKLAAFTRGSTVSIHARCTVPLGLQIRAEFGLVASHADGPSMPKIQRQQASNTTSDCQNHLFLQITYNFYIGACIKDLQK